MLRHETADIAVLITAGHPDVKPLKDMGPEASIGPGFDFFAYGYPDLFLTPRRPPPNPPPRVFKGYFQRIFEYWEDYRYLAGEMSIACPRGLSGGPILAIGSGRLVGVATQNLRSATEATENGKPIFDVINYGVCLLIDPIRPWLDEVFAQSPFGDSDDSSDSRT